MYPAAIFAGQISFLMLYQRVFSLRGKRFRIAVLATGVFAVVSFVGMLLVTIFMCRPVHHIWLMPRPKSLNCLPFHRVFGAGLAFNFFTDALIVLLPLPIVWRFKIQRWERIAIVVLFSVGLL